MRADLIKAQKKRYDEFVTLFDDISSELENYKSQLKGKRILCPCDWDESYNEKTIYLKGKFKKKTSSSNCNFSKFLLAQAENYGIKSITSSGYNPANGKGKKFQDIDYSKYDVVITNPPFSRFIEFIKILFKNKIKFIVIGPQTGVHYKDVFQFIINKKLKLGYAKQLIGFQLRNGKKILSANKGGQTGIPRACKWFTNLTVSKDIDEFVPTAKYNKNVHPNFCNYKKAINVPDVNLIPDNYKGEIGVPTTFMSKYNPKQFDIIGKTSTVNRNPKWVGDKAGLWIEYDKNLHDIYQKKFKEKGKFFTINGKKIKLYQPFERIIIKAKNKK